MLNITRGVEPTAQKIVIYGVEGIGKSTLASQFPEPLFIDTEGSTKHLDVARTSAPKSWAELLQMIDAVRGERPCQTLVIDTIDWAERLAAEQVISEAGNPKVKSIEDFGYGAGYTKLVETFAKLLDRLSDVAEAGINVVVVAHADIRKFEQPDEAASYDRWELKLSKSGTKKVAPLVKEWADAVLFLNYKTVVETVSAGMGTAKGKARGGQVRAMYAQHHACWDAKNRWGLPSECSMDYAQIAPYIPAGLMQQPATTSASTMPAVETKQPAAATAPAPETAALSASLPVSSDVLAQARAAEAKLDEVREKIAAPASSPVAPFYELEGLPAYWEPALRLMSSAGISVDEVRLMAADKGFFTSETPAANYPEAFVDGCLVAQWDACRKHIESMRAGAPPVSTTSDGGTITIPFS